MCRFLLGSFLAGFGLVGAVAAPFTPGNLVIYRVGDGAAALTNTGTAVFLDEFTPAGALVQSIPLPTTTSGQNRRIVASGTAASEGFMQRSTDGQYLMATGYDAALAATGLATSVSSAVPRVIARADKDGQINTTTALTDASSGNNPRSAASVNGSAFWFGGGSGGVRYATLGATASTDLTSATLANIRQPGIFGGQLFASSTSGTNTFKGVSTVGTGLPTSGSPSVSRLTGLTDTNATAVNMFFMADLSSAVSGLDTLYMTDENGTSGGLTKFSLVSGVWLANGKVGVGSDNYRGLTGVVSGSTVTLFATRNGVDVVKVVDETGYNATVTATASVLATAGTNKAFRGVALAPQAILPDLTVAVSAPTNAVTGSPFAYTLSAANVGTTSATSVVARFTLPAGLSFVSGSGSHGFSAAHAGGVVTFSGGSLAVTEQATLTIQVTAGSVGTYAVSTGAALMDPSGVIAEALETNNGSTQTPSTVVVLPNSPPSFTQQPSSASLANGASTTLNALAVGNPTPTYQWYLGSAGNTSQPISGATNASYTTPALYVNTSYWVRATNSQGAADSSTAVLTVAPSTVATLSALSVGGFHFFPTFSAAQTTYTALVGSSVSSLSVTPTSSSAYATITVNGSAVVSGAASSAINLLEGENVISIVIIAQDGVTSETYTLRVIRSAPALSTGALAFVAFNADADDDLAFVLLEGVPENTVIHFSDNEWNGQPLGAGGDFVDFAENEFAWMPPPGGLAAGSVVVMNGLGLAVPTVSVGTFFASDGATRGFSAAGSETIHAFMGSSHVPTVFLGALSTDPLVNLAGTGLSIGTTCVKLADSSDGGAYSGPRSGQAAFSNYLAYLGAVGANWTDVLDADGTVLLPFSTAAFSLVGSPIYTSTNRDVLIPNRDVWPSAGVTHQGLQFINLGLQGVGRIPSSLVDSSTGETVGSLSDMQVTGFSAVGNGSYTGTFHFLPDGGYRGGSANPNSAARIQQFTFTFTPHTAATATSAQNQVAMTYVGSSRFTYDHDNNSGTPAIFTSGMAPTGVGTVLGASAPVVTASTTQADGAISSRLTFTGEGLVLDRRTGKAGTGWVSDEFEPGLYHFDANKKLDARLGVPMALIPHAPAGTLNFGTDAPVNGRRENQGFEGITQSPDGTRLFAMLQSATVQDSDSGNEGRFNTRVWVYDVSATDAPGAPIAQYVMQLPRLDETGSTANGTTVNRTGGQSSLLALSNTAFLVLSRDGNGRGTSGSAAPVFKSILLADLSGATNLGTSSTEEAGAVAPSGVLQAGITPISWTQALNLIGGLGPFSAEVGKFGLNLSGGDGTNQTLSDKWESTALVSCADPAYPNDFFLFVGNDNNFQSTSGKYMNAAGTLSTYNAGLAHDSMVLAYRVRVVAPGIRLTQGGLLLSDEQSQPVSFSSTTPVSFVAKSFTLQNAGTGSLGSIVASLVGADAEHFSLATSPASELATGASTSFTVHFTPPAESGAQNATLRLTSTAPGSEAIFEVPLQGVSTSPLMAWRQVYFGTTESSGNAADTADPDGDGLVNLLEFALASDPTLPVGENGLAALPAATLAESAPELSGRLVLKFDVPTDASFDVTYLVQVSEDLENWTHVAQKVGTGPWSWLAGGTSRVLTLVQSGYTQVKVGDTVALPTARRQMRLQVTRQ